jgi:excisionase family DNA binding protein
MQMPRLSATTKPARQTVEKLLYRRQEAAFALGLSVRSIDAMIADRRLTTRRFGRCIVIPASDVRRVAETILDHDMLQGVSPSHA